MKKLRMHYCSKKQMSESFLTAAFLSVSGGLQDMCVCKDIAGDLIILENFL